MNLFDLTEAARCTDCKGQAYAPRTDWSVPALPCPRCKDHPGIDPDIIHVFESMGDVPRIWPTKVKLDNLPADVNKWLAVVIPVDPA